LKYWRTPLDRDQIVIPHGLVAIIPARCKGCGLCEVFCPRRVLRMSTSFNAKGYYLPEVVDADACVACGLCQIICPEFSIHVIESEVGGRTSEAR